MSKDGIVRNYGGSRKFIDPLSPTTCTDVSPANAVTAFNVPLTDFGNEVTNDLYRDMYWSIYLAQSKLKEIAPVGREDVRRLVEWVLQDPLFKPRTLFASNRKMISAATAYTMVEELLAMDQVQSAMDQTDQAENLEKDAQKKEDGRHPKPENQNQRAPEQELDGDREDSNDLSDSDNDQQDEQKQDRPPDEMRDEADGLRDRAKDNIDSIVESDFQNFNRSGSIDSGAEFGGDVLGFMRSWGVDGDGAMMLDPETLMKLMKMLTVNDIGKLLQMVGRVFGVASKTLNGRAPVEVSVDEGGLTRDIMSLHPGEFYKLTPNYAGREQAIEDWLIRGLQGVKKTSQAKYEGSFICIEDQSSSMDWLAFDGYTRKEVAKAISLGLAKAARLNGQEFYLAGFGHEGQFTDLITPRTPLLQVLEWAVHEFDGETSFDDAFANMLDIVQGMSEEERKLTDFLMITDGECQISQEIMDAILDEKEIYGAKLIVLMIGREAQSELYEIADEVLDCTNLENVSDKLSEVLWL